jgi:hypothetical protein
MWNKLAESLAGSSMQDLTQQIAESTAKAEGHAEMVAQNTKKIADGIEKLGGARAT